MAAAGERHKDGRKPSAATDGDSSWLGVPEFPTGQELIAPDRQPLLINDITRAPASKNTYLETHYRLLRTEGIQMLREAVAEFRLCPKMMDSRNTYIYTNVHAFGYILSRTSAVCRVGFSTERSERRVKWDLSNRLVPGTLVALSPANDNFATKCFIATVESRHLRGGLMPDPDLKESEETTPPRLDISWTSPEDAVTNPGQELVMLEARNGYYEAVRHAMTGLQAAASQKSPLDKYIMGDFREEVRPEYLQKAVDDGKVLEIRPSPGKSSVRMVSMSEDLVETLGNDSPLDKSQLTALGKILSSELVQVLGPPGTGKTFTSVAALDLLVDNFGLEDRGPIIVSAQSNYAIDQLLLHCTKHNLNFTRLGRRSREESIANRSLYTLRMLAERSRRTFRHETQRKNLDRAFEQTLRITFGSGMLNPSELCDAGIITGEQRDSLGTTFDQNTVVEKSTVVNKKNDSPAGVFTIWLGDQLQRDCGMVYKRPEHQDEAEPDDDYVEIKRRGLDDDDHDRAQGKYHELKVGWTGYVAPECKKWRTAAKQELRVGDLYMITAKRRGMVYRYLQEQFLEVQSQKLRTLLQQHSLLVKKLRTERFQFDAKVIKEHEVQIIGCTTTGLSKYRELLEILKPKIMFIEEAGETWEANVTSCLMPSLQQLVLIGDHEQLRPHCDVGYLGRSPYNLTISLFQRLIQMQPSMGHVTLKVQRRMVPELRKILDPFYPDTQDHSLVHELAPVPGMPVNTCFFYHQWLDSTNSANSRYNTEEARMIAGFFYYLVQSGVEPEQITVLTFYRGQQFALLDQLRGFPGMEAINPKMVLNVRTVDGFQGEENDIILLSLVRSQRSGQSDAGFLRERNRVIVSMSRARRGLYVFGDARNVLSDEIASIVWRPIADYFDVRDKLLESLPLQCLKHNNEAWVEEPDQWLQTLGGCGEPCGSETCEHGRRCPMLCHPSPCKPVPCDQPCSKTLACGHGCQRLCGQLCFCAEHGNCLGNMQYLGHRLIDDVPGVVLDREKKQDDSAKAAAAVDLLSQDNIFGGAGDDRTGRLIELDEDFIDLESSDQGKTIIDDAQNGLAMPAAPDVLGDLLGDMNENEKALMAKIEQREQVNVGTQDSLAMPLLVLEDTEKALVANVGQWKHTNVDIQESLALLSVPDDDTENALVSKAGQQDKANVDMQGGLARPLVPDLLRDLLGDVDETEQALVSKAEQEEMANVDMQGGLARPLVPDLVNDLLGDVDETEQALVSKAGQQEKADVDMQSGFARPLVPDMVGDLFGDLLGDLLGNFNLVGNMDGTKTAPLARVEERAGDSKINMGLLGDLLGLMDDNEKPLPATAADDDIIEQRDEMSRQLDEMVAEYEQKIGRAM